MEGLRIMHYHIYNSLSAETKMIGFDKENVALSKFHQVLSLGYEMNFVVEKISEYKYKITPRDGSVWESVVEFISCDSNKCTTDELKMCICGMH